jgi:hypothetical protein
MASEDYSNFIEKTQYYKNCSIRELVELKKTDFQSFRKYGVKKILNFKYFMLIHNECEDIFKTWIFYKKSNNYKHLCKLGKIKIPILISTHTGLYGEIELETEYCTQNTLIKFIKYLKTISDLTNLKSYIINTNMNSLKNEVLDEWYKNKKSEREIFEVCKFKIDPVTLLTGEDKLTFFQNLVKNGKITDNNLTELFNSTIELFE